MNMTRNPHLQTLLLMLLILGRPSAASPPYHDQRRPPVREAQRGGQSPSPVARTPQAIAPPPAACGQKEPIVFQPWTLDELKTRFGVLTPPLGHQWPPVGTWTLTTVLQCSWTATALGIKYGDGKQEFTVSEFLEQINLWETYLNQYGYSLRDGRETGVLQCTGDMMVGHNNNLLSLAAGQHYVLYDRKLEAVVGWDYPILQGQQPVIQGTGVATIEKSLSQSGTVQMAIQNAPNNTPDTGNLLASLRGGYVVPPVSPGGTGTLGKGTISALGGPPGQSATPQSGLEFRWPQTPGSWYSTGVFGNPNTLAAEGRAYAQINVDGGEAKMRAEVKALGYAFNTNPAGYEIASGFVEAKATQAQSSIDAEVKVLGQSVWSYSKPQDSNDVALAASRPWSAAVGDQLTLGVAVNQQLQLLKAHVPLVDLQFMAGPVPMYFKVLWKNDAWFNLSGFAGMEANPLKLVASLSATPTFKSAIDASVGVAFAIVRLGVYCTLVLVDWAFQAVGVAKLDIDASPNQTQYLSLLTFGKNKFDMLAGEIGARVEIPWFWNWRTVLEYAFWKWPAGWKLGGFVWWHEKSIPL